MHRRCCLPEAGNIVKCLSYIEEARCLKVKWVPVFSPEGVNRPERDTNHTPLFIAEIKNEWSYPRTPPICPGGVDRVMSPFSCQFELVVQQYRHIA